MRCIHHEFSKDFKVLRNNKVFTEKQDNLRSTFVVVVGTMPAYIVIYDENANPIFELGRLHRNFLQVSSNKRFMVLGGFGNLPCDYELFDMK